MSNTYRTDRNHPMGNELLTALQGISDNFAKLKALRLALIQMRNGSGATIADYVPVVNMVGYLKVDSSVDDGTVAKASFEEIDAFVNNGGPSLEQCCARHKQ